MQLFTQPEAVAFLYPFRKLGNQDRFLFLDIETTGLSAKNSQIWLIGTLSHTEQEGWVLRQWFSETLEDEAAMLRSFFDFAAGFSTLITFSGTRFDLPFLIDCAAQYGISHPFAEMTSLDLYRSVRPYRSLLGAGGLSRKALERWLGITRLDKLSGEALAEVYGQYQASPDTALLQQLLLHNEEDLTILPQLISLLNYRDFLEGSFRFESCADGEEALTLALRSETVLPKAIEIKAPEDVRLTAEESLLTAVIPKKRGLYYHYFSNYRDYYYLPLEDRAVHKSIGAFVDASARVKATRETACVKKDGVFLPLFGDWDDETPVFRKGIKDTAEYAEADLLDLGKEENAVRYLEQLLRVLKLRT